MREDAQKWLKTFLEKRDIARPDGRELYRYRTKDQDFLELETLLRNWLVALPQQINLALLADDWLFSQLFVLYASEWWRRRYDGSGVAWDPIIIDLRSDPAAWSQQQRSRCVQIGLERWKCQLRRHGGYRFILSIALQGGLPMKLVAEGRGRLGKLLKRILHLCGDIAGDDYQGAAEVREQDIYGWIESLQAMLPKSFRQPVIFHLLTEIIVTVLRLKREAKLTSSEDALSQLDRSVPGWRNQFSMPLEDEHAQGLIAQLLKDAAAVVIARQSGSPFLLERSLEKGEQGWRLVSSLLLQESIDTQNLEKFFAIDAAKLPRQVDVSLTTGEKRQTVTLRRIAGKDKFRVMRQFEDILDTAASQDHMLQIDLADGCGWRALAHHGEELDDGFPWIFSARSGNLFIKQGGGKIAEAEALIVMPDSWQIAIQDENSTCEQKGEVRFYARYVWQIRGKVTVCSEKGEIFRFQTGRADATQTSYHWQGEPFWLDFRSPSRAFRCMPELFTVSAEGMTRKVSGIPEFNILGSKGLNVNQGPVLGQYLEGGEIRCRTRMVLLPQEASVEMRGRDAVSGAISLLHWGCSQARILTPGVLLDLEKGDHSLVLHTSLAPDTRTPEQVELEIYWPHSTTPVRLALPYPAKGARAFSIQGEEWKNGTRISLLQLLGARIVVQIPHSSSHVELVLRAEQDNSSRTFTIARAENSTQMVVRLQHFAESIRNMLSMSNELDAMIAVAIIADGSEIFRLMVSRYQGHLKPVEGMACLDDTSLRVLDLETLGRIRIFACNLILESDRVIEIEQRTSEGNPTGIWPFVKEGHTVGPWLLYPHRDTPIALRPLLMPVPGDLSEYVQGNKGLAGILSTADQRSRMEALAQFVASLATNYLHEGWAEVEQWAEQIGHLSLTAFDLWRAFARSGAGMAAIAFRLGGIPQNFLHQFSIEMPFDWATISYLDWKEAMTNLRNQCEYLYSADAWHVVFSARLASVCEKLAEENPELQYLLGIASADFTEGGQRMVVGLQHGLGPQAGKELFDGDDCKMQQLFHRHAEDEWPGGLQEILLQAKSHPDYSRYLCSTSHGFKDPVINLPLLLAAQCADGNTKEWFTNPELMNMLRLCRSFDSEWFEHALNLTIARCLADNFLQL